MTMRHKKLECLPRETFFSVRSIPKWSTFQASSTEVGSWLSPGGWTGTNSLAYFDYSSVMKEMVWWHWHLVGATHQPDKSRVNLGRRHFVENDGEDERRRRRDVRFELLTKRCHERNGGRLQVAELVMRLEHELGSPDARLERGREKLVAERRVVVQQEEHGGLVEIILAEVDLLLRPALADVELARHPERLLFPGCGRVRCAGVNVLNFFVTFPPTF